MGITPKEMYQNRLKVIEYLKNPKLRKAKELLRDEKGGRCCLGHMCDVLNVPMVFENRVYYYGEEKEHEVAPRELIEAVGLWNSNGGTFSYSTLKNTEQISLVGLNDRERISPQKIGEYLETVIFGGEDTPWRYINPEDI